MKNIEKVMIATDLSDPSMLALDAGKTMAQRFGAKVLLTYVAEDRIPPLGLIEYGGVDIAELERQHREKAQARLEVLAAELRSHDLEVTATVGQGIAHRELIEIARGNEIDLIVVGTHGRGFVSHAILGSTAERIARNAPCPLLVVRDPRAED